MGSAASKTARAAPPRKYPTRAAGASPAQTQKRAPRARLQEQRQPESSAQAQPPRPPRPREPAQEAEANPRPNLESEPAAGPPTDEKDIDFASRLRQMGIVQPNPTFSPSSTAGPVQLPTSGSRPVGGVEVRGHDEDILRQMERHRQQYAQPLHNRNASAAGSASRPNNTLSVLEARRRIQDQAALDDENIGQSGREFLSALTLRDALVLRSRGIAPAAIEKRLHLKEGVVARLGPPGLFEALNVADVSEDMAQSAPKTK